MTVGFERAYVLWLIPFVLVLVLFVESKSRKRLSNFVKNFFYAGNDFRRKRNLEVFCVLFSIAFAILSLSGPYLKGNSYRNLLSCVILLDVSWSMAAQDYPEPILSRFEMAKYAIGNLLNHYKKGKAAIIVFGKRAFVRTPVLRDLEALNWIVQNWIYLGQAPEQGTNIKSGLEAALLLLDKEFRENPEKINGVVILISDATPKDMVSVPYDILSEYRKNSVKILSFGVGKPEPYTLKLPIGCDKDCKTYNVPLNEAELVEISRISRGNYIRIVTGKEILEEVVKHPEAFSKVEVFAERPLYQFPLGISILFFVLWILILTGKI
jgi:uncharacterized protein YegL